MDNYLLLGMFIAIILFFFLIVEIAITTYISYKEHKEHIRNMKNVHMCEKLSRTK